MHSIVILNNPKHWNFNIDGVEIISAKTYLTDSRYSEIQHCRIFNLCRSYSYQSTGYYVSLLAEARDHRAIPSIATIQDFKSQTIIRTISDEIDELIQKSFAKLKSREFVLSIYFRRNMAKQYDHLSKKLYNLFRAPLLRAYFIFNKKKWVLQDIETIPLNEIPETHMPYVIEFAKAYFLRKRFFPVKFQKSFYDLAILINPNESEPASDKRAIRKFITAAEKVGFKTEIITKDDYSRIPEFDALFIRETTAVNHYTYRFSRRAYAEGLVVIDDPLSILKCSNKVYLAELLAKAKIPTPKTLLIHRDNRDIIEKELGLPCVLKKPDSSFSQGVIKIDNRETLHQELDNLLKLSDLIIAQEYTRTEFDWRIGILDKKPLYACKYYMVNGHWQIYNWKSPRRSGVTECLSLKKVPEKVIEMAQRAANLIGDGFYGVDLKQVGEKVVVIEVNDNPSIESGEEDVILKDRLYLTVMRSFIARLETMRKNQI